MISIRGIPSKIDPALAGILHDLRRSVVALNEAATKSSTPTAVQRAAKNLSGQTPVSSPSSSSSSSDSLSTADIVAAVLADARIAQLLPLVNLVGTDEGLEGSINKLAGDTQVALDDKQPLNAGLTDISGLSKADGQVIIGDGSHFVGESGSTLRAHIGLSIGTDVQAHSANLTEIAALTSGDGNVIIGDGTDWTAESGATLQAHLGLEIGADVQAHSDILDDLAAGVTGWGTPTGTLDRTAIAAYAGQTVSSTYTQTEIQAIDDAIKKVSQSLAALITDLKTLQVLQS